MNSIFIMVHSHLDTGTKSRKHQKKMPVMLYAGKNETQIINRMGQLLN